jgi:hypothetical protein
MFLSQRSLEREKSYVEGFAPKIAWMSPDRSGKAKSFGASFCVYNTTISSGPAHLFLSATSVRLLNFDSSNIHCPTSRTVSPRPPFPSRVRCLDISISKKKLPGVAFLPLRVAWDNWGFRFKVSSYMILTFPSHRPLRAVFLAIESVPHWERASARPRCWFTTVVPRSSRNLHPECKSLNGTSSPSPNTSDRKMRNSQKNTSKLCQLVFAKSPLRRSSP